MKTLHSNPDSNQEIAEQAITIEGIEGIERIFEEIDSVRAEMSAVIPDEEVIDQMSPQENAANLKNNISNILVQLSHVWELSQEERDENKKQTMEYLKNVVEFFYDGKEVSHTEVLEENNSVFSRLFRAENFDHFEDLSLIRKYYESLQPGLRIDGFDYSLSMYALGGVSAEEFIRKEKERIESLQEVVQKIYNRYEK